MRKTRSRKLPTEIRDQLTTTGKIEARLRRLETIDTTDASTVAGEYRLSWLIPLIVQDRKARAEIRRLERELDRLLDKYGTTLRDEPGIGPIAAATLLAEVGDPLRFARESKRDIDEARIYFDRKLTEGKTRREARRAHKRHLANRVIRRMWNDQQQRQNEQLQHAA